jgi:hypothetical protein
VSVPPPGGWQPPQQPGPPPSQGQPYGPPGYNPPLGWQQGVWPQPGPPPQQGNNLKWLLIGVSVLLVIGISVGATLIFTRDGGGGGTTTTTSGAPSDVASANDTGPVTIITDEPTCAKFVNISNSLVDIQRQGWGDSRESLGPSAEWTSDQRAQVEAVARAMRNAADQSFSLLKQTPHRVIRELYEQFIVYGRAYADSVPGYSPADDALASANVNAGSAIIGICNTITYGSSGRGVALAAAPQPTELARVGDPADPQRFIKAPDSTCVEWVRRLDEFNAETTAWADSDPSVPASQWTPERRALEQSVQPLIEAYANNIDTLGRQSKNPVLEDFASSAALYLRAYLTVGDNYKVADGWLSSVGFKFANLVSGACLAVSG